MGMRWAVPHQGGPLLPASPSPASPPHRLVTGVPSQEGWAPSLDQVYTEVCCVRLRGGGREATGRGGEPAVTLGPGSGVRWGSPWLGPGPLQPSPHPLHPALQPGLCTGWPCGLLGPRTYWLKPLPFPRETSSSPGWVGAALESLPYMCNRGVPADAPLKQVRVASPAPGPPSPLAQPLGAPSPDPSPHSLDPEQGAPSRPPKAVGGEGWAGAAEAQVRGGQPHG